MQKKKQCRKTSHIAHLYFKDWHALYMKYKSYEAILLKKDVLLIN